MRHSLTRLVCLLALLSCQKEPQGLAGSYYHHNARTQDVEGLIRHDAFAVYVFRTNAPRISFTARSTFDTQWVKIGGEVLVLIDGVVKQRFTLSQNQEAETFTVQLTSPGEHLIELVEGSQVRAHEQGAVQFTSILSVDAPAGYSKQVIKSTHKSEGIAVFGDSRTQGGGYKEAAQSAWPVQLRRLRKANVYVLGYNSLQLGEHITKEPSRTALTEEIRTALASHSRKVLIVQADINDYSYATYTPEQLATAIGAWLPEVKKAVPDVRITWITSTVKADESANKLGYTLQQYREAIAIAARSYGAKVINGQEISTVADLADGTHLTTKADSSLARRINERVGIE